MLYTRRHSRSTRFRWKFQKKFRDPRFRDPSGAGKRKRGRHKQFVKDEKLDQPNGYIARAVFGALTTFPCIRSIKELVEIVWDDPDREPFNPENSIRVSICTMNRNFFPRHMPWLRIVARAGYFRLVLHRP